MPQRTKQLAADESEAATGDARKLHVQDLGSEHFVETLTFVSNFVRPRKIFNAHQGTTRRVQSLASNFAVNVICKAWLNCNQSEQ